MPRERKLQIVVKRGKIYARTTYIGLDGKRHALWRAGKNRTKAKEKLQKALDELKNDEGAITHAKKTFAELAKWYEDRYLVEPVYRDGRIIKGRRSWKSQRYLLIPIKSALGTYKLRSLPHDDQIQKRRTKQQMFRLIFAAHKDSACISICFRAEHKGQLITRSDKH